MPSPQTRSVILLGLALTACARTASGQSTRPASEPERLRLAVVGLVHGHVYGFLQSAVQRQDIELVGLVDPSENLLDRYGRHHHKLPPSILYRDLDRMLAEARPQAVAVFTDTFGHQAVVEACAARGVHVMMEKPLAVSLEHAKAIERAAARGRIHVLVNFETTWYPTTHAAGQIVNERKQLGRVRRIVINDGHQGPKELGMPREFVDWLTDPVRNGAGALYDFGCYGTNLATWLMQDRRPQSVFAVTRRLKSDPTYANVDDDATIVLAYDDAQVVIQASWNWPYNRKDMEIYGERGAMIAPDAVNYRLRLEGAGESQARADAPSGVPNDPISYLVAVVRGENAPSGPSSLQTNMIATEILEAARRSAATGRQIPLEPD